MIFSWLSSARRTLQACSSTLNTQNSKLAAEGWKQSDLAKVGQLNSNGIGCSSSSASIVEAEFVVSTL